jgi:rhomboid protease GluP
MESLSQQELPIPDETAWTLLSIPIRQSQRQHYYFPPWQSRLGMFILGGMDINSESKPEADQDNWLQVHPGGTKKQVELWALVLDSRAIPCCIRREDAGWLLFVPPEQLLKARHELSLYMEKNRNWPPQLPPPRAMIENTLPTISVLVLLATFHNLTLIGVSLPDHGYLDLPELGLAHANAILDGQWWRLVTALTLHANLAHLASNLAIGGTFIIFLCRELGSGLSWSLLLSTGILGNLLNAIVQSPDHRSVGASTAVFGAVGIFAAISMIRYRQQLFKRWLVPVAAGLALLALLGAEGKQTDLGAHLFGFVFGIVLGTSAELLICRFGRPGGAMNSLLAMASAALVLTAWWAAIELG